MNFSILVSNAVEEKLWVNSDLNNLGVQRDPETKCFELLACRKPHKPECPRPRTFFTLCSNLRGSHCRPPGPLPGCYCSTEEKTDILTYSKDLSLHSTQHRGYQTLQHTDKCYSTRPISKSSRVHYSFHHKFWVKLRHGVAGWTQCGRFTSMTSSRLSLVFLGEACPFPSPILPSVGIPSCEVQLLLFIKIPLGFQILFREIRSVSNANCIWMPEPGGCGATLPYSFCGHQFLIITKRVVTEMNDDWVDKHTKIPPETPKPQPPDTLAHSVPKHRKVSVALPLWRVSRNNYYESCS